MSENLPFVERMINGTEYKCSTMHLAKWAELTELLAGLLGDPIASLLRGDTAVAPGADPRLSSGDIQGMIGKLSKKLDAKTIMKLTVIMGNCLFENGRPLGSKKQETWWPCHMADLAPVVRLFLEAQYADFYEGLSDSMSSGHSGNQDHLENTND